MPFWLQDQKCKRELQGCRTRYLVGKYPICKKFRSQDCDRDFIISRLLLFLPPGDRHSNLPFHDLDRESLSTYKCGNHGK